MTLKPFFTYYGGKYRAAPRYPAPKHDMIIEPFAGAAGYSLRHPDKDVFLFDKDPVIASLWAWLIEAREEEIRDLPTEVTDLREMYLRPEAKALIGFWLNKGTSRPCNTPSAWMRQGTRASSFWGSVIRERIASQLQFIRHWRVLQASYDDIPSVEATWFVDPPYQKAGKHYKEGAQGIDFEHLALWCRSRQGQVIVCENEGADWLPFTPFQTIKANQSKTGGKVSVEVIWTREAA